MACGKLLLASLMVFVLICNSADGYPYLVLQDPYLMRGCPLIDDCPGDYIPSRCRRYEIIALDDGTLCRDCPYSICDDDTE